MLVRTYSGGGLGFELPLPLEISPVHLLTGCTHNSEISKFVLYLTISTALGASLPNVEGAAAS